MGGFYIFGCDNKLNSHLGSGGSGAGQGFLRQVPENNENPKQSRRHLSIERPWKERHDGQQEEETLNDPWDREGVVRRLSGGGGGSVTRSKDNRGLGKNKEPRSAGNQKNSIMNTNNLLFDILRFGAFWVADQKRPSPKTEPIRTTIKTSSFPLSCGHPESAG